MKTMKRLLSTLYIVLASLVAMTGCSKVEPEPLPDNDEYYVKYAFVAKDGYWDGNVNFMSEKGLMETAVHLSSAMRYEVVTGPFKYNDKVCASFLDSTGPPHTSYTSKSIQIFVSKNDSPFALKGMTNEDRLEYTIDY